MCYNARFVVAADQTPTPTTRLIRNCEEFGLFDDLKHVNPFEETFRQAIDGNGKTSNTFLSTQKSLELIKSNDDETLHTPIPLKYTTTNADKEKKPSNDLKTLRTEKSSDQSTTTTTKVLVTSVIRKKVNWPKPIADNSDSKSLETARQKSFRKIHPKPVIVSTVNNISNPIKEKIRQSLLKCQTMHNEDKNTTIGHLSAVNIDIPKVEIKPKAIKTTTTTKNNNKNAKDNSANERNREAAKRYRNKQKILHDKLLIRNAQLEAEVVRLKHQLDTFKKAHEKCPVTQSTCGTLEFK